MISKLEKPLLSLLAAASVIYLISLLQHTLTPSHYSDIGYLYYRDMVGTLHRIPYVEYPVEYPPLVGILIYLCGFFSGPLAYTLAMGVALYPFMLGLTYSLYRVCVVSKIDYNRIFLFCLLTPTMLHFSFYNWDLIPVCFMVVSIYLFLLGRMKLSAASLGLGIAGKFYPGILLPIFLFSEIKRWREKIEFALTAFASYAAVNLPFAVINPQMWWTTYTWIGTGPVENSWWRLVEGPPLHVPLNPYIKILVVIMFTSLLIVILKSKTNFFQKGWLVSASLLLSFTGIPPQFAMILLPFWVLVKEAPLLYFYLFDMLNALIIVVWFSWLPDPIHLIGYIRQLLLLPFMFYLLAPKLSAHKIWRWLTSPISPFQEGKPKEVVVERKPVKKPVKILPKIKRMVTLLVSPIEEEIEEEK